VAVVEAKVVAVVVVVVITIIVVVIIIVITAEQSSQDIIGPKWSACGLIPLTDVLLL